MRLQTVLLAILLFASPTTAFSESTPEHSWDGTYVYIDELRVPPNTFGSEKVVEYKLIIGRHAKSFGCILTADGHLSDDRINCIISGNRERITVSFKNFEDDREVVRYKVGRPLFILKRQGKKIEVLWRQLKPDLYFKKNERYYLNQCRKNEDCGVWVH